jgi:hypothetical protein
MIVNARLPIFQSLAYREVGTHAIPGRLDTVEMAKHFSGHKSQNGQAWSEDQNLSLFFLLYKFSVNRDNKWSQYCYRSSNLPKILKSFL